MLNTCWTTFHMLSSQNLNFFMLNLPQKESFAVSLGSHLDSVACKRKMLNTFLVSPYGFKGS